MFKNLFSTFIEPASSINVLKSSRIFLEHLKRKHVITRWMMGKTWLPELEGKCRGSSKTFVLEFLDGKNESSIA